MKNMPEAPAVSSLFASKRVAISFQRLRPWKALAALAMTAAAGLCHAADVSVAVAANFSAPMREIAAAFEQASGHRVQVSSGSTAKLYAQIKHGAPFQVLLAADAATPARLEREGAAVAGTRFTYAVGRLVLWSKDAALVDADGAVLKEDRRFTRLSIANPKLAPYGAAAMEVLHALGLAEQLAAKIVQGENIGQAWQFVATGNAPLGFVALSQIMREGRITEGSAWIVPQRLYAPIAQDAVLLNAGLDAPATRELLDFLKGPQARTIIASYGYGFAP